MNNRWICIAIQALALPLFAQNAPPKQATPQPASERRVLLPAQPEPEFVLFPLEQRDRVRDYQHEDDQLEIENQKMLLKIEQNRVRQGVLRDAIGTTATQFALSKNLEPLKYELDPAQLRLVRKRTP